jgi:glycosyltransferase involved in cell wall biosynthesis
MKLDDCTCDILQIMKFPGPITGQTLGAKKSYEVLSEVYKVKTINLADKKWLLNVLVCRPLRYRYLYMTYPSSWKGFILLKLIVRFLPKSIVILHARTNNHSFLNRQRISWLNANVNTIVYMSESLKECFEKNFNCKLKLVPNFIEESEGVSIDMLKNNIPVISYISSFLEGKGYKEILNFALWCEENKIELRFDFYGRFYSEEVKNDVLSSINNLSSVSYLGVLKSRDEVYNVLLHSDLLMLLTQYELEAVPRSILEALHLGVPVISTYHAGIPGIFENFSHEYLIKNIHSSEEIYQKVLSLLEKPRIERESEAKNIFKKYTHDYKNKLTQVFN